MLSEIRCDSFHQKVISFHEGLNVVLGTNNGDNSIGKSTLLLIVDFVFGGGTYAENEDIKKNVGNHEIKFKFVFDNREYYFSRLNDDNTQVWKCDSEYNKVESISLEEYRNWLDEQYRIQLCDLSFRNCVSRYMRVYGKKNFNENEPLRGYEKEKTKDSILACIKTFDKYREIKDAEELSKQAQEQYSAFNKATKFNFVPSIGKTEYKSNVKSIDELKNEIKLLSSDLENNLLDASSETTEETIRTRNELSKLKKQRYHILNKIKTLSLNEDYSFSKTTKDFEILKSFFPEVDIKRVEEIESFHNKISKVFKKQAAEEKNVLQRQLDDINDSIKQLENKLVTLSDNSKLSTVVLQRHAELMNQINKMDEANKSYDQKLKLKGNKDETTKALNTIKIKQLNKIEEQLNNKMKEINSKIYNVNTASPTINFSGDSYSFYTPNDTGTGTAHKGLIVFDLAMVNLTKVPTLIHDSILLKQISNGALTNILKQYVKCGKQIFIAFDKQNTYGNEAASILENNSVIKLSRNGNELFGKYWGKISA